MACERNEETRSVKKSSTCLGRRTILEIILFTLLVLAIAKTEALRTSRSRDTRRSTDSEPELEGYTYNKPRIGLDEIPNTDAQNSRPYPQNNKPNAQNSRTYPQNNGPNAQNSKPYSQNSRTYPQNNEPNAQNNEPNAQNSKPYPQNNGLKPRNGESNAQNSETYPQNNEPNAQNSRTYPQNNEPNAQNSRTYSQNNEPNAQNSKPYPQNNELKPRNGESNEQNNEPNAQNGESNAQNSEPNAQNDDSSICNTPGCIRAAMQVMDSFDETIDPCDNFYEFACGNFLKNTPLPADKQTVDSFSIVRDMLQNQLKSIFDEPAMPNEPKANKLAKNFYQACLDQSVAEGRGNQPLADILEAFGGWPVVKGDSWNEADFDWVEALKKFRMFGLSPNVIFSFSVQTDKFDSTKRIIDIDRTTLELESQFLTKGFAAKEVQAYHKYMVDNAVIFGANNERAEQELREALEFETKLAEISLSETRSASGIYKPTKISELQQLYPFLNWLDFFMAMVPNGLNVNENELVTDSAPKFFEKLGQVLASTPKRTIANYMLWRIVAMSSGTQTEQLRELKFQFFKNVYGLAEKEERWKECITFTAMSLPIAVGNLYVRKFFPEESKEVAVAMVSDIQNEFFNTLQHTEWMDEGTRAAAIQKAKLLTAHVAYPNELIQDDKLEELYADLEIEPDNLLSNTMRLKKYTTDYSFSQLRKPVNKTDWVTHSKPILVNVYYKSRDNSIVVPAAILQDRFFDADRPKYMNYGAIGQIVGHEITHGFDRKGGQYDANGDIHGWWLPKAKQQFSERAQCFVGQYDSYTERQTMLMLNGKSTQDEDIADNGGTRLAYNAYNNWLKHNKPEEKLPGLKYNQQQLFWISSAQVWCSVSTDKFIKNKIKTGMDSPNEFRVNGVVSNMPEFANDFMCPLGAPMNPENKCKVW